MNLSVGDGIAIAGCAASAVYLLRYTFGGWAKMRQAAAIAKAVINGANAAVDKIVAASKD